ncbi:MAG: hypothetical protein ABW224_21430 [Kibdelosporangium sp.]
MTVKPQRRVRRPKVAGHNRPRPAQPETPAPEDLLTEEPAPEESASEELLTDESAPEESASEELLTDESVTEDLVEGEVPAKRSRLPLVLVTVAAVLTGLGVFFLVKAQSSEQGVDTGTMTEVNGQVTGGLEKIFSFSYDKIDETGAAAREVLAGTAVGEYDKLIEQVRAQAPAQKLVLATKVTTAGVKSIDGDRAELLVFLDQVATRADTGKTSGSAAALSVTAERHSGTWKITTLTPR